MQMQATLVSNSGDKKRIHRSSSGSASGQTKAERCNKRRKARFGIVWNLYPRLTKDEGRACRRHLVENPSD